MMKYNLMCKECGYVPSVYYGHQPVCNNTFEEYNKNRPICGEHKFVEIDEDILLAMSIIVGKGYKTNFSCSGHLMEGINAGYVYFMKPLDPEIVPKSEWIHVEDDNRVIRGIERHCTDEPLSEIDMVVLLEDISMFKYELLKWAVSLPVKK